MHVELEFSLTSVALGSKCKSRLPLKMWERDFFHSSRLWLSEDTSRLCTFTFGSQISSALDTSLSVNICTDTRVTKCTESNRHDFIHYSLSIAMNMSV